MPNTPSFLFFPISVASSSFSKSSSHSHLTLNFSPPSSWSHFCFPASHGERRQRGSLARLKVSSGHVSLSPFSSFSGEIGGSSNGKEVKLRFFLCFLSEASFLIDFLHLPSHPLVSLRTTHTSGWFPANNAAAGDGWSPSLILELRWGSYLRFFSLLCERF